MEDDVPVTGKNLLCYLPVLSGVQETGWYTLIVIREHVDRLSHMGFPELTPVFSNEVSFMSAGLSAGGATSNGSSLITLRRVGGVAVNRTRHVGGPMKISNAPAARA
jgi:hypothetical protein